MFAHVGPCALVQPATLARYKSIIYTIFLIFIWYSVNITLIITNKWLISETGFRSTSMLTLLHMLTSLAASSTLLGLGFVPSRPLSPGLGAKVAVLAASFTVATGTCMASLAYLPASFVQAIGSTTPGFTAVLAYLIQGRREAGSTYLVLLPVVVGIALASGGEPLFSGVGLVLQLVACLARSFKTVLQALLLTDDQDRLHPMTLLAYTSALSSLMLAALTAVTEPHSLRHAAALQAANPSFGPLMAVGCTLAFLANFTNFLISKRLGALTLQVLGNLKNVLAAVSALAVFGNPVTAMGLMGYGITTGGVFAYSALVHKHPARWEASPLSRLLDGAFAYRPAPEAAEVRKEAVPWGAGDPAARVPSSHLLGGLRGAENGQGQEGGGKGLLAEGPRLKGVVVNGVEGGGAPAVGGIPIGHRTEPKWRGEAAGEAGEGVPLLVGDTRV